MGTSDHSQKRRMTDDEDGSFASVKKQVKVEEKPYGDEMQEMMSKFSKITERERLVMRLQNAAVQMNLVKLTASATLF